MASNTLGWGAGELLGDSPLRLALMASVWTAVNLAGVCLIVVLASGKPLWAGLKHTASAIVFPQVELAALGVCLAALWFQHAALALIVFVLVWTRAGVTRRATELADVAARAKEEAHRQAARAYLDGLTGLANRSALEDRLARVQGPGALLLVDVDHFKHINDTHGHLAGDGVLRSIAAVLDGVTRSGDLCARYGGEEFCIVLDGSVGDDLLLQVAERVRVGVATLHLPEVDRRPVTVSVGGAAWTDPADAADALRRADASLYAAKHEGRNRVHVLEVSARLRAA